MLVLLRSASTAARCYKGRTRLGAAKPRSGSSHSTRSEAFVIRAGRPGGVPRFAGVGDRWRDPATGEPVASCTIIVTDANAGPIHDCMPLILDKEDFEPWLIGAAGAERLSPAADDRLRVWPVSRRFNKSGSGDDDPTLIDKVGA